MLINDIEKWEQAVNCCNTGTGKVNPISPYHQSRTWRFKKIDSNIHGACNYTSPPCRCLNIQFSVGNTLCWVLVRM